MKYLTCCIILLASYFCSAEPAGHWGVGIGSNYGGPGVKYSQEVTKSIDLYANAGLPALFALLSYRTGSVASVGAEYAFTNNQHHTLGFGYAYLHYEGEKTWSFNQQKYVSNNDNLTGSVLGYTYYFSGLRSTGQALGCSVIHLTEKKAHEPMQTVGDTDLSSLSISWGYRF
jgi:hypothetical protein